ncbi:class I SAM-dependent methyltransferase [Bradyrhizobium betae]|uniref:Methyltransferase domain-containing protein n=1 Tax=Bradyrhizobium betae TaxID=244734 RepID=A0A5P6NZG3_9BRAD|nr:class I SAM-dependent methyltransferase [Bradyrhizobium betae]MCS3725339.1 cyclopropane fatty-acyl-phospholipid synthase-like methyltransferase [Bradyrhizobium betae]QFI71345.1 methyltransferase domain-containing protein [Bradyrhizobium betae]
MTDIHSIHGAELPGSGLDIAKMPGHWLLARLGKRVLRPGGLKLTRTLLADLAIGPADEVVEFAPGLGGTARLILQREPLRYTAIERDAQAAQWTARQLPSAPSISVVVGRADRTLLPAGSASAVVGEAMLSMQTAEHKRMIAAEAYRLLRPGGRYGIHELAIVPDDMPSDRQQEIDRALSSVIHVGARPLRSREWKDLLQGVGFRVVAIGHAPMHLLRPLRLVEDEGILGALRLAGNLLKDDAARRRVMAMRWVFERYRSNLSAIYVVAEKDP